MADEPSKLKKIASLFVTVDESKPPEVGDDGEGGEKTPAEVVAELAGKAGVPPAGRAAAPMPSLKLDAAQGAPKGPADFDVIFRDAGMDAAELDRVKKAEELLRSLPEATPQNVKKQIVEASLKAFGFEIDKIVLAANNQKRALDAYVKVNEGATTKAITDAEAQIKSFNEKIAALRTEIERRTQTLAGVTSQAQSRKAQVQKVIDFFQAPAAPGA